MSAMSEKREPKKDKFDEFGQIVGGYDLGLARGFALEHAKKTIGESVGDGEDRRSLIWNIERSGWDEDAECWEVVLSVQPERAQVEQKGIWVYHVRPVGGLLPGTPLLRQSLIYNVPKPAVEGHALPVAAAAPGELARPQSPPPAFEAKPARPPAPPALQQAAAIPRAKATGAVAFHLTPGLLLGVSGIALFLAALILADQLGQVSLVRWTVYVAVFLAVGGLVLDMTLSRHRGIRSRTPSLDIGLVCGMVASAWLFAVPLGIRGPNYSVYVVPSVWGRVPFSFYAFLGGAMAVWCYLSHRSVARAVMVGVTGLLMAWSASFLAVWVWGPLGWHIAAFTSPLLLVSYAAPVLFFARPRTAGSKGDRLGETR